MLRVVKCYDWFKDIVILSSLFEILVLTYTVTISKVEYLKETIFEAAFGTFYIDRFFKGIVKFFFVGPMNNI